MCLRSIKEASLVNAWLLVMLTSAALFAQGSQGLIHLKVDASQRFQTIDGFGVNFNGPYFRDSQKPMIDLLVDDLGATIFRLDPYGDDLSNWELVNDNDDPKRMNWEYYNNRYSMPNFEASWAAMRYLNAKGVQVFPSLIGIVPEWMLDDKARPPQHKVCRPSQESHRPDHLSPGMYEEFAEMVVSMAAYARTQEHLNFDYLSPFNETDCYPSEGPRIDPEEASTVLAVLARRMKQEGLGDLKLVVVDQANVSTNYMGLILQDPELMKQVGVFSFHTYGEESVGPQVERLSHSQFPRTRIWLTEYGDLNDQDKTFENEWKNQSLAATRRALRALNQGATAALFWDAFDNFEMCERRLSYYGLMRNDHHVYSPKKRYFAAKQLFRFVRPESERIAIDHDDSNLMISAFRDGTAHSIIIVGVKQGAPKQAELTFSPTTDLPTVWELYETTPTIDCRKMDTLVAKDGVLHMDLPSEAIFTLVGNIRKAK